MYDESIPPPNIPQHYVSQNDEAMQRSAPRKGKNVTYRSGPERSTQIAYIIAKNDHDRGNICVCLFTLKNGFVLQNEKFICYRNKVSSKSTVTGVLEIPKIDRQMDRNVQ